MFRYNIQQLSAKYYPYTCYNTIKSIPRKSLSLFIKPDEFTL